MGSDELFEKEYENLNDAILKAIVSSREVQKILITLKEQEEINDIAVLNLFLSLDELYEMISEKNNKTSCVYKSEPAESNTLKHKEELVKKVDSLGNNENISSAVVTSNNSKSSLKPCFSVVSNISS